MTLLTLTKIDIERDSFLTETENRRNHGITHTHG